MRLVFLLGITLCWASLSAQDRHLPKGFAPWEARKFEAAQYSVPQHRNNQVFFTPPASPIRTAAEWEEIQALTITWRSFPAILAQIVDHARHEAMVLIVCNDSVTVKNYLSNYGITDFSNIQYLQKASNSVWSRDYQGNTAYLNGVDSLVMVDWIYNRPRPADNVLPFAIGEYFDIPVYSTSQAPTDLVHTGGNFMSDGFGTGFSSELVYNENAPGNNYSVTPKSPAQVDQIMNNFMGIHTYVVMPTLPYDGIHHIDMHMKLLDEETLLISEYPVGVSDGPQIEANIQYIQSNFTSVFGTPYRIVRVPAPPAANGNYPPQGHYRTYANATFVNRTLLVPTYQEFYDTTALRIISENLPGYNVVGINCNAIIPSGGAIHCITHSIGVDDPLLISHQALSDQPASMTDYRVEALVMHRSGISEALLHYSTDPDFSQAMMLELEPVSGQDNVFEAYIPMHAPGTVIYYYIAAESNTGKTQVRPMTAPDGFWQFKVLDDAVSASDPGYYSGMTLDPVFPNPAGAITAIPVNLSNAGHLDVSLHDIYGRKVAEIHSGVTSAGSHHFFFHAANYPAGIYVVRVTTETAVASRQIVIQSNR